ncbi:MAG TPA: ABC-F family ATP-binding cassette domain-containing protein [Gemmatimonadota bacterium]|nr:ABC-F family ATP-binding cassette domain-containing protein [Gemmatimonadota bacterium]
MISVSDLAKAYSGDPLFEGVSLHLATGCRYGLVGANGSGKTTFLRILSGEIPPSDGTVSIPKRARVGVLHQDRFRYADVPIVDVVVMGVPELWSAMRAKEEVLARAGHGFDADRFAEAEETVQRLDGYSMEARAGEILEGLGIPSAVHQEPLSTLSGGFQLRVLLAQALAASPEVLLLDEPTNHLDIVSIRWLEKHLADYAGCLVVISHDHRFLDRVATHVLDVDYETITLYPGNYTDFVGAKAAERERRETEIEKRQKEIADKQAFVDRFRAKASKARQAQSRVKQIERIEIEPLPQSSRRHPTFRFVQSRPSGKVALKMEGISKSYAGRPVLAGVSLRVQRGDRLAVIGPNGIGKSTLLKIAVGQVEADAGKVEWGHEARPGWFAQDHQEQLTPGQTAEAWLWRACPGQGPGFVRGQLGLVLLGGDAAEKPVEKLAGGEAARLLFARLAVEKPNVLVLDEPTNHLDLEGVEALAEGLDAYDGTVVFVAHDRWFVERLATRIVELSESGARDFLGGYADYVASCGDDHLDVSAAAPSREPSDRERSRGARVEERSDEREARKRERAEERRRAEIRAERDRLLNAVESAETRLAEIHARFADPALYEAAPPEEIRELQEEERSVAERLEALTVEWEAAERSLVERESPA